MFVYPSPSHVVTVRGTFVDLTLMNNHAVNFVLELYGVLGVHSCTLHWGQFNLCASSSLVILIHFFLRVSPLDSVVSLVENLSRFLIAILLTTMLCSR